MAALNFNYVLVGVVAVVGIAIILALLNRYDVFNRDDAAPATERVQRDAEKADAESVDYTIPLLKRHKKLTLPGKLFVLCTNLILLSGIVYVYLVLKSGHPVDVPYAGAMQGFAVGAVGVVTGIAIARYQDLQRGTAVVTYEDEDGNVKDHETIYYDPKDADTDKDGNVILAEHHRARLLGLFSRRKLTGEDRELRGEVAMMDEVVKHAVPSHADRIDKRTWKWRTQGQKPTGSESAPSHYVYSSPIELPYEKHVERHEKMEKMSTKMDSLYAQLGEAWDEINRLRRKTDEDEDDVMRKRIEEFRAFVEALPNMGTSNYQIRQSGPQRHPQSQSEVNEMNQRNGQHKGQNR